MGKKKAKGFVSSSLQKMDLFGQSINFTIKGEDKTRSTFGGCVTLLMMLVLFIYGII
jgi:hypothetical protein